MKAAEKAKIQELRDEGIVFVSYDASALFARGGFFILLAALPWHALFAKFRTLFFTQDFAQDVVPIISILGACAVGAVGIIVGASVCFTFLQTKFFFRIQSVDLDAFEGRSPALFFFDLLVTGFFLFYVWKQMQFATFLLFTLQDPMPWAKNTTVSLLIAGGIGLFILGTVAWNIDRNKFMKKVIGGVGH